MLKIGIFKKATKYQARLTRPTSWVEYFIKMP